MAVSQDGDKLGVGLIGAGFMGSVHLTGLMEIERRGLLPVRVAGVADAVSKKARVAADRAKCEAFRDADALLASREVGAVVIAAETDRHLPLARAAVAAGKAVFLEKPMGRNLHESRKVARVLLRSRLPHQIGLVLRFSPTYNVLKSLVEETHKNGPFLFCRFRDDQNFPIGPHYGSTWRSEAEKAGAGTLLEHSIHDVDVLNWFFGEPTVTDARTIASEHPGIEKLAALNLRFRRGGFGQLASVWHGNLARENERHIEIFCERRFFQTDGGYVSPIRIQGPGNSERTLSAEDVEKRFLKMIRWADPDNADFPRTAAYELYVFLKRVLRGGGGGGSRPVDAEVGIAAHRVIESAYQIAAKGHGR